MSNIFNKVKNVNLKNIEFYSEESEFGKEFFIKAVYEYEDKTGVYELEIPKMRIPIYTNRLPVIERELSFGNTDISANLGFGYFDLYDVISGKCDVLPYKYIIKTIKEKQYEMTLEEIEKELGYKIKVVSEKK